MTIDQLLDFGREPIPQAADNPAVRLVDWILRGVGQVVFQSNWVSGLVILVAIGVNSLPYLVAAIVGTAVSTVTAALLGVDRGLLDAGLLGFNGCLAGIALNFYMSQDFTNGEWPDPQLYLYIVLTAAFSSVIFGAVGSLLGDRLVPALTAPFVFASWLMLFGVYQFTGFTPGSLLSPGAAGPLVETASYSWGTFIEGTFKGVGEIFFQDNAITGAIMVVGVLINTRIGAMMCLGGSAMAALLAMAAGADEGAVRAGLYGFNAALTAIALGGFFFVLTKAGFIYTLFGVAVTTFVWPAIGVVLTPIGMPTFTFPFVLTTWLFLLAKPSFAVLRPIAPADATYPEDNLRRWRNQELAPGL